MTKGRPLIAGLFPPYEEDWFRSVSAALCYNQHGGSGYSFTLNDVRTMSLDDIEFYCEWLEETRKEEASKIRAASKSK